MAVPGTPVENPCSRGDISPHKLIEPHVLVPAGQAAEDPKNRRLSCEALETFQYLDVARRERWSLHERDDTSAGGFPLRIEPSVRSNPFGRMTMTSGMPITLGL